MELLSMHPSQVFDRGAHLRICLGLGQRGDSAVVAEHIRRIRAKFAAAGCRGPHCHCVGRGLQMAVKLFSKKAPLRRQGALAPARVPAVGAGAHHGAVRVGRFLLIALRAGGWNGPGTPCTSSTSPLTTPMKWKRRILPVSRTAPLLYVEATIAHAYVDPDTGEIYPHRNHLPPLFIPAGPLRFFYKNVGANCRRRLVLTAALAFLIDAWWFYRWKIKKAFGSAEQRLSKIAQNDLDSHVESPSSDEMGRLCQSLRPCGPL